jgi:hypothetical protein
MRIVRSGFLTYTQADGLATDRVGRIFEDRDGTLCVAGNDLAAHRAFTWLASTARNSTASLSRGL